MRPRNVGLERHLTLIAAEAAGHPNDHGLGAFADRRALLGPVRDEGRDWPREIAEELADARNYCVWGRYDRLMRGLAGVIAAWHAVHG